MTKLENLKLEPLNFKEIKNNTQIKICESLPFKITLYKEKKDLCKKQPVNCKYAIMGELCFKKVFLSTYEIQNFNKKY